MITARIAYPESLAIVGLHTNNMAKAWAEIAARWPDAATSVSVVATRTNRGVIVEQKILHENYATR